MMNANELSALFDGIPQAALTEEEKSACQRVSDYFADRIHSKKESVFSAMAHGAPRSLSRLLRMTIPGEESWSLVEQMRRAIFGGAAKEEIVRLYFASIDATFSYLDAGLMRKELSRDDIFDAVLAFYDTYASRCFSLDAKLYEDVRRGVSASFLPFLEQYLSAYRTHMKPVMSIASFGAERNDNAAYREATCSYVEYLLCCAAYYAFFFQLSADSFHAFVSSLTEDILADSEAFYRCWYDMNNEVMDRAYKDGKYAKLLFDVFNTSNEFTVASKKIYEKNIMEIPVARESDMRELYRTVYELRRELDAVKKELREVKGC